MRSLSLPRQEHSPSVTYLYCDLAAESPLERELQNPPIISPTFALASEFSESLAKYPSVDEILMLYLHTTTKNQS